MQKQSFQSRAIYYLDNYKKRIWPLLEEGEYNHHGTIIKYDHILPKRKRNLNILPDYREVFWASEYRKINLHRFFHHLNSSQALCINLFYPLIAEGLISEVGRYINISLDHPECKFEHESEIESQYKATRKTNFDFFISDDNQRVYFEVKYTENGFGSAKNDDEHREKFNLVYKPLLLDNLYINDESKSQEFFLQHYQIMRNLVHINENSTAVFVFPKHNQRVFDQANYAYEHILTDVGRTKFHRIYLEEFIPFLMDNADAPVKHYTEFWDKYLMCV